MSEKMFPEFEKFPKVPRFSRDIIITEKIDGTNGQVYITDSGEVYAGSRNRWVTPYNDNMGFATWVYSHKDKLRDLLGPGRHFGEWWGFGIQRGYGIGFKMFSLFNTHRWQGLITDYGLSVVPVLYQGPFSERYIYACLRALKVHGSFASRGFMQPEGVVIFHTASNSLFKKTLENDEKGKGNG